MSHGRSWDDGGWARRGWSGWSGWSGWPDAGGGWWDDKGAAAAEAAAGAAARASADGQRVPSSPPSPVGTAGAAPAAAPAPPPSQPGPSAGTAAAVPPQPRGPPPAAKAATAATPATPATPATAATPAAVETHGAAGGGDPALDAAAAVRQAMATAAMIERRDRLAQQQLHDQQQHAQQNDVQQNAAQQLHDVQPQEQQNEEARVAAAVATDRARMQEAAGLHQAVAAGSGWTIKVSYGHATPSTYFVVAQKAMLSKGKVQPDGRLTITSQEMLVNPGDAKAAAEREKPYVLMIDQNHAYCGLCRSWADDGHLEGKGHRAQSTQWWKVSDMAVWHDVPDDCNDRLIAKKEQEARQAAMEQQQQQEATMLQQQQQAAMQQQQDTMQQQPPQDVMQQQHPPDTDAAADAAAFYATADPTAQNQHDIGLLMAAFDALERRMQDVEMFTIHREVGQRNADRSRSPRTAAARGEPAAAAPAAAPLAAAAPPAVPGAAAAPAAVLPPWRATT